MYVGLSDSQVLATLEKNAAAASASTSPFPLHSQYVPAVLAGRGGDDKNKNEDSDVEGDSKSPKAKKKKRKIRIRKVAGNLPKKNRKGGWFKKRLLRKHGVTTLSGMSSSKIFAPVVKKPSKNPPIYGIWALKKLNI